jgi:two-component system nitrogen regulation response regulator NtrX
VGAERTERVDVRVLAATNRQLAQHVAGGTFREDLYFRLNVFPIELAPLRDRLEDLPDLVAHLAARVRPIGTPTFTAEALAALSEYRWPGNIRELANIVERILIVNGGAREIGVAEVQDVLPAVDATVRASGPRPQASELPLSEALDEYERQLIRGAMAKAGGNVAEVARSLQTDRANLYRRMRRLGL